MQINKITLTNFGSYEGTNEIETSVSKSKNIVLFGGANGAGKTTLFRSIGLCLYGYTSLGYASQSNKYANLVKSLINNKEKQNKPANMSIMLDITMENEQGIDNYTLNRKWILDEDLTEKFYVLKNGNELSEQDIADYEKYLLSVIPPEMFNLYFFDGERITDFFTDQYGNKRLKDAFLTICGYDTFDIMNNNFKRNNQKDKRNPKYEEYLKIKELNADNKKKVDECKKLIDDTISKIRDCDSDLELIEKKFVTSGGITEKEWNKKEEEIKKEENKREELNYEIKKLANDIIPFLMIEKDIAKLKKTIINEKEVEKINSFEEIVNSELFSNYFNNNKKIKTDLLKIVNNSNISKRKILDLSFEQESNIVSEINKVLSFDKNIINKYKKEIEISLKKTSALRKEMSKLSSSNSNDYINKKMALIDEKNSLINIRSQAEQDYIDLSNRYVESNDKLLKVQSILENEIKQESINNISVKAVLMLDKLQEKLYKDKIAKLETNLRKNISLMMTKDDLISEVMIDDNFVLHVYQNEVLSSKDIINYLSSDSNERLIYPKYIEELYSKAKVKKIDVIKMLKNNANKHNVPMEISISTLSAGERQMLILSLYLSLVDLGKAKIPFVIDTPFARMDKTHRINISKYFFSSLKGQIFVLSTNKEIDKEHTKIIGHKVSKVYTLQNSKGSRTSIIKDKYF